jgi:hypothetical protein
MSVYAMKQHRSLEVEVQKIVDCTHEGVKSQTATYGIDSTTTQAIVVSAIEWSKTVSPEREVTKTPEYESLVQPCSAKSLFPPLTRIHPVQIGSLNIIDRGVTAGIWKPKGQNWCHVCAQQISNR